MARIRTTGLYVEKEVDESLKDDKGQSPIPVPGRFSDSDWAERIEMAKRAREFGKKIRKGKPAMFSRNRGFRK